MSTPTTIDGWPGGVNNLAPDHALPAGTLRSGVNIDILDDGKVRRRKGLTSILQAAALYGGTSYNGAIHYVEDGALKRLDGDATVTLREGLAHHPMAFLELNGDLYYSNGADTGLLREGADLPWGVECASGPPTLGLISGAIQAGTYLCVCTYARTDGEEGGCARASVIASAVGQGIVITPPLPIGADLEWVNIYLTAPDDDVFRFVGRVGIGQTLSLLTQPQRGRELRTRYLQPMPPATSLCAYNGRIYGASGRVLWCSEPLFYGQCNVVKNFLLFADDISAVVAHDDGIYVGSDVLYFLAGAGLGEFQLRQTMPCQLAAHSVTGIPDSQDSLVLSTRGLLRLMAGGSVKQFNENVMPSPAIEGSTFVREQDGLSQYIGVATKTAGVSSFVATDYMEAEIIRRS